MALKSYKPTTPGQRGLVLIDRSELWKGRPVKSLTEGLTKTGGRNNTGRITMWHKGGGAKRLYRIVDFKRRKFDIAAVVERIEYDPNRTAFIALVKYAEGELNSIQAPQRLAVGDQVIAGAKTDVKPGNAMPFSGMPIGAIVHNVELKPGKGGQLARAAGTYALHAVVPVDCLVRVPDSVALEDAAAIALVFITGWEAMVERAAVGQGDLVLIHAGAGGTGQMATQIARAMGARVATTVSSAQKAEFSLAAGAELIIRYKDEDFCAAVMDWSGGDGVRAVLDNIGGDGFLNSLRVLQPYGHIVTLMGTPGDLPDGTAYNGNLTIHNVMMLTPMWKGLRNHLIRQAAILQKAMDWLAEGKVFVRIQDRFPLVKAAEAHRLLESAGGSGKIILTMPAE